MSRVIPGDVLGSLASALPGRGTYIDGELIRASLLGERAEDPSSGEVHVLSALASDRRDPAIEVGDVVLARVIRVMTGQVSLELLAVNDRPLSSRLLGCIKREDVRLHEEERLVMQDFFRLGDVVRAGVLSLGDARQYFLTTAEEHFGVRFALSCEGNLMSPVSWKVSLRLESGQVSYVSDKEMEDTVTGLRERRKVARP